MQKSTQLKESLAKLYCYKCGASLESAKFVMISQAPLARVAHAVCQNCQAESMVTLTDLGSASIPVLSDLTGDEFSFFMKAQTTSYDDLLDLHKMLKKDNIWSLLQNQEQNLENNQNQ